jgi:tripartite ATP-independent transporter DctM subunit
MEFSWLPAAVLMVIFFTLLAFGLWIGISLILVGFIALHFFTSMPAGKILGLSIWNTLNNWPLTCLPLFIFMGDILSRSKLSEQLFSGLAPWVHRLPGKLLHVNVLGCALFAAISGSSAATCATIGKITLPEFKRLKYDEALSVGSIAGSGTLGFMIPPSIVMIIYGVLADVSVGKLFMAGVVPGLMMAAIFMGYVILRGVLNPAITPGATRFTRRDRLHSLPKLIPILSLIVVVLGTIYTGLATPTEAAAIGVGGALLIGWFTRTLTWQNLRESLQASTVTTCMMCLIVVGATYFSMAMSYLGIPQRSVMAVAEMKLSPYAVILALSVLYIILGCLMDSGSMIVITLPFAAPIVKLAGFDPVWFGIYLVIMSELGQITPPVGFNLFVLQNVAQKPIGYITRATVPFMLLLLLSALIITFFPGIPLWLPGQMMSK